LFQPLAREGKIIRAYTAGMGWVEKKSGRISDRVSEKIFSSDRLRISDRKNDRVLAFGLRVTRPIPENPTHP